MASDILVSTGWGNGLLPDGTEQLPEPMMTYHQARPVTIAEGNIPDSPIIKTRLKATYLKLNSNFPGNNELITKFWRQQPCLVKLRPQSAYWVPFTKSLTSKHTMPMYWAAEFFMCVFWVSVYVDAAEYSSAILLCMNIFKDTLDICTYMADDYSRYWN